MTLQSFTFSSFELKIFTFKAVFIYDPCYENLMLRYHSDRFSRIYIIYFEVTLVSDNQDF